MSVHIRVIEWLAPGYEGQFTQYTVFTRDPMGLVAELFIDQVSTRDNMSRAMSMPWLNRPRLGSFDSLVAVVDDLIQNRCADGGCRELLDRDPRKCGECEHPKFMHGPEVGGCIECRCTQVWIATEDDA